MNYVLKSADGQYLSEDRTLVPFKEAMLFDNLETVKAYSRFNKLAVHRLSIYELTERAVILPFAVRTVVTIAMDNTSQDYGRYHGSTVTIVEVFEKVTGKHTYLVTDGCLTKFTVQHKDIVPCGP